MTVLRAQPSPANKFPTVQITVQYRSIFVLLFGQYSLQCVYDLLSLSCSVLSSSKDSFVYCKPHKTKSYILSKKSYDRSNPNPFEAVVVSDRC